MPDLVGMEVSALTHIVSATSLSSTKTYLFKGKTMVSSPSLTDCAVVRSCALAIRLGGESVELFGPGVKSRLYLCMLIRGAWDVLRSL